MRARAREHALEVTAPLINEAEALFFV